MRILQVSAHFPPDFVSGGTLQPQRIARALRARGHEVRVLAGSLDPKREVLDAWVDEDETGLPVHWVASGDFIWWDDERNYDNPPITSLARDLLSDWRPDVVHCHSLQSLGVGAIDAAVELGVPVVVTMHDFWWLCARQFLVDTDNRPCSLVVDASDCPCEAGRDHLERRARRLRRTLDRVALVLVPSQSAADVLIANGIDSGLIEVDENGVPDPSVGPPRAREQPNAGGRVTLRYTGGSNPLKGADVVLDALGHLGVLRNVRVVVHNLEEALARRALDPIEVGAELAPPYPPDELDKVLADTDVLLLPSVARETYSLVTREALARGVPVIASDVLGPEEVVEDGRNGLIIPAADPEALAAAIRSIDDDPGVVDRWRSRIGKVTLRSIDQQTDDLVARYANLTTRPNAPARAPDLPRVLFVVGIGGAPLRYRAQLPAEALSLLGARSVVRHYLDPELDAASEGSTHVVVYRVPATPNMLDHIGRWRASGKPVAFDVDDLIFDPSIAGEVPALSLLEEAEAALWLEGVRRYRTTMEACDAYIGSTRRLVGHAEEAVGIPSFLFENGVGQVIGAASDRALRRPRAPGPVRVGYLSGTKTHDDDWRSVEPAVVRVLERQPETELWLGGHLTVDDDLRGLLGHRLRTIPFTPWHQLPEVLRDLDVNLAPLAPASRFNDAKSAIKWLEAALCETPTIASPTEPFQAAIEHGETGLLAATDEDWEAAIERLIEDAHERGRIGRKAKRSALLRWSPPLQAQRYLGLLERITAAHHDRRTPNAGWTPALRDERSGTARVPLDEYPPPPSGIRTAVSSREAHEAAQPGRLRRGASLVGTTWREEGALVAGRKVARSVARRVMRRLRSR